MAVNEVRSVMTALRILDAIAAEEPVGVSELARLLALPKSSVQRILHTLHSAGWIQPVGVEVTRWGLTTHMLRLGRAAGSELTLRDVAIPVMEELRTQTQETVHLAVAEQDNVICIERLDSPQAVRTFVPLGKAVPIAASANGKAILASYSPEKLEATLGGGLRAYTQTTVIDRDELIAQLEDVRRNGYATNQEEWRSGIAAVAAMIPTPEGRAVAGISISTPVQRMNRTLQREYGELVKAAAKRIGEGLGVG